MTDGTTEKISHTLEKMMRPTLFRSIMIGVRITRGFAVGREPGLNS